MPVRVPNLTSGNRGWNGNNPQWMWQPTIASHDPNPPLPLETPTSAAGRSTAVITVATLVVGRTPAPASGVASILVVTTAGGATPLQPGVPIEARGGIFAPA